MIEEAGNKTRMVSLPVPEELVRSAEFLGEELGWDESIQERMNSQAEYIGESLRKSQTSQQEQQD